MSGPRRSLCAQGMPVQAEGEVTAVNRHSSIGEYNCLLAETFLRACIDRGDGAACRRSLVRMHYGAANMSQEDGKISASCAHAAFRLLLAMRWSWDFPCNRVIGIGI